MSASGFDRQKTTPTQSSRTRQTPARGARLHRPRSDDLVERKVWLDKEHYEAFQTLQVAGVLLCGRMPSLSILVYRGLELLAERYKEAILNEEVREAEVAELRRIAPQIDNEQTSGQRKD